MIFYIFVEFNLILTALQHPQRHQALFIANNPKFLLKIKQICILKKQLFELKVTKNYWNPLLPSTCSLKSHLRHKLLIAAESSSSENREHSSTIRRFKSSSNRRVSDPVKDSCLQCSPEPVIQRVRVRGHLQGAFNKRLPRVCFQRWPPRLRLAVQGVLSLEFFYQISHGLRCT